MPTQTINLNDALPAPPAGKQNNKWQADPPSLDPTVIRDVSTYTPNFVGDAGAGGLAGSVPAPAAGDAAAGKFLKADGTWTTQQMTIGFGVPNGTVANTTGPGRMVAPRAGTIARCVVVVNASDPVNGLVFRIKQNGTDIFTADPAISAGAAAGTVSIFTTLTSTPLNVAQHDVFTIDVTGGGSAWNFTAQLEG